MADWKECLWIITESVECVTIIDSKSKKSKVFYGQEPPSGESTTTDCGVNYQLLSVIY